MFNENSSPSFFTQRISDLLNKTRLKTRGVWLVGRRGRLALAVILFTPGFRNLFSSFVVNLENSAERDDARRNQKRIWSPTEIAAVMRHFRNHIARGKLATKIECQQCKNAEHPAFASRSVQNIRDFVRNRGLTLKKKQSQDTQ